MNMTAIDFFFHYHNVGRFILLNKFSSCCFNSHDILRFSKVLVCFSIKDLENIDDLSISNYYFFNFFFFGIQSFFFNFNSVFRLGIMYYSFIVQCIFIKKFIFFILNFLINEKLDISLIKKDGKAYWRYEVSDLSLFIDKRAVVGLFYIVKPLDFFFFFSSS
jgi:hypothetical protein